ncbi:MAG TPA: MFS transporter [Solirubrobacteraceae bacterium]|nr:MFS transporter [Solirubrobacteraceae bacterium]
MSVNPFLAVRTAAAGLPALVRLAGGSRLVAAAMLDAVGTGLILPLTVLLFVVHERVPAHLVGLGISIGGVIALLLAPLGGHLVDRIGSKHALIGAWLLGCAAVACYVLVRSWLEIIGVITALSFAGNISSTARSTLLASIVESSQLSRVMAIARSFRNAGYGVGGLLATAALVAGSSGFLLAVYGDATSFLLAALLVSGMTSRPTPPRAVDIVRDDVTLRTVLTDWRYIAVTGFDALISFHQVALQVALPLWVVLYTHAPRALVGLLFTLNTVVVVIAQVRVSRDVRGLAQAPRTYVRGGLSMVAASAAFLSAHYVGARAAVVLLVIGALFMTCAEMLCSAADWVVSFGLADDDHRGKYLAVYSMGNSLGDAVGPSVSTALLSAGAVVVWPAIAAIVAVGSLASAAVAHSASRDRRVSGADPALS